MVCKIPHLISIQILALFLLLVGCAKDEGLPVNPYDNLADGSNLKDTVQLDSNSIASIHQDILLPKCSTPGCHDGSFEPDFRTINSSYSTLVYHPILKNNDSLDFKYRVVPFLPEQSVLYERITNCCFVNQDDRMPQDQIGVPLPDNDIERIRNWIEAGAQNYKGDLIVFPNTEVVISNFAMHNASDYPKTSTVDRYTDKKFRMDTTTNASPILLDTGIQVFLHFKTEDDSTLAENMMNVRIEFSYDVEDFSAPFKTVTGIYFEPSNKWHCIFDIDNSFMSDTTIFIRSYANDNDHVLDTEYPNKNTSNYTKNYWSIQVKD